MYKNLPGGRVSSQNKFLFRLILASPSGSLSKLQTLLERLIAFQSGGSSLQLLSFVDPYSLHMFVQTP